MYTLECIDLKRNYSLDQTVNRVAVRSRLRSISARQTLGVEDERTRSMQGIDRFHPNSAHLVLMLIMPLLALTIKNKPGNRARFESG
jgi:hypothetical protein